MPIAPSVVICTYTASRWPLLVRAMSSVLHQRDGVDELILVIDHNARLTQRAREYWANAKAGPLPVRVVENRFSRGLSGARNTGLLLSRSSVVAFLDDDAEADPCWIGSLIRAFEDEGVLACGGAVLAELAGPRPSWWPPEFDWVVGCSYAGLPTARSDIRNPIGANMSVRRDAARAVNGFSKSVGRIGSKPAGCEETELCIRLRQRWPRARVVYEPSAVVRHFVPQERLSWVYFTSRCYFEGVSKASIAARVGSGAALASERSYSSKVLPRAAGAALLSACRGERGAWQRALAIAAGLTVTTAGYVRGRLSARGVARPPLTTP